MRSIRPRLRRRERLHPSQFSRDRALGLARAATPRPRILDEGLGLRPLDRPIATATSGPKPSRGRLRAWQTVCGFLAGLKPASTVESPRFQFWLAQANLPSDQTGWFALRNPGPPPFPVFQ